MTPKDFFLHIASMIALYISASSILILLFQVINYAFPDTLAFTGYSYQYDPYSGPIRWAIASLIVVFPLYIYFVNWLNKDYAANPEKKNLGLKRWLTYLTLFLAGATIACDLVAIINTFLGGEITIRFVLKGLAVLVVACVIFSYYIRDLKSNSSLPRAEREAFRWTAIVLVLAAIVTGFLVMGSPMKQRMVRFDNQKVNDMQNIQWRIIDTWRTEQGLPENIAALNDSLSGYVLPKDPQTGLDYEYTKTASTTFNICANFNLPSPTAPSPTTGETSRIYPYDSSMENWKHGAGRTCFERKINPKDFPPMPTRY